MPPPPYIVTMQQDIAELQVLMIGNPSIPNSGVKDRVATLELKEKYSSDELKEIKDVLRRLNWLVLGGLVIAALNLIIARPNPTLPGATQTTSIQTSAASPKDYRIVPQNGVPLPQITAASVKPDPNTDKP